MKPCSRNRKLLAWLALGNLDAEWAAPLREHVAACEGCRSYLEELAKVTASISGAEIKADIVATESFHRQIIASVKASQPRVVGPTIAELLRGALLKWRIAVPALGGIVALLVIGLLLTTRPRPENPIPESSSAPSDSQQILDSDFRPTIANYQMVANQSLERLDQVLTEQGSRKLPPAPVYTASTFIAADVSN
jgi:hypothetical protein